MNNNETPTQPPQAEIKQPQPATPKDVGAEVPKMHPVHKTKMTLLIVVTVLLGIASLVSLVLMLRMKSGQNNEAISIETVVEKPVVVPEKKTEMESSDGFDPVDVVKELDELGLEDIEKEYLESGLD